MDPNRDKLAKEIFASALEKEDGAVRERYLDEACGADPALRQEVESLLQAHTQAGDFLQPNPTQPTGQALAEGPGAEAAASATVRLAPPGEEEVGAVIGRYKLLEKIGEGGFGAVYVAEQREPVKRRVALKIIKLGMDTRQVVARFEAERQALALMDHPNIARIFDAGVTGQKPEERSEISGQRSEGGAAGFLTSDLGPLTSGSGRPYFVMELVKGIKITDYCDQNNLSTRERLDLFVQVCHAIQHAHQKGIIHRDIKPSNILVTLHDGVPVPKVIDFGIAKATQGQLTDKTIYTQLHQFIGTPAYMSPEQAEMSGLDVDTRGDIYSLGVLLYELLTGQTPFDAQALLEAGLDEMRRIIREKEPMRPSTRLSTMGESELTTVAKHRQADPPKLIHFVRGDLDWIVMKCLEKDRRRRYETANGLAHDVERHLNNEAVLACPPSKLYRFQKLVRRNKVVFAAASVVAMTLVVGLVVSMWMFARERQARQRAVAAEQAQNQARQEAENARAEEVTQRRRAEAETYAADMKAASVALEKQNYAEARGLLRNYLPRPGLPELRGVEWRYLWQATQGDDLQVFRHGSPVLAMAASPDQQWLLTGGLDARLAVWNLATERVTAHYGPLPVETAVSIAVPLATISSGGRMFAYTTTNGICVRELQNQRVLTNLATAGLVVQFSPNGQWLVGRQDTNLMAWDVVSWTPHVLATSLRPGRPVLAFSSDSRWLVYGNHVMSRPDRPGTEPAFVADLERPGEVRLLPEVPVGFSLRSLACSPDGQWLACGVFAGEILIFDFQSGRRVTNWLAHSRSPSALGFSPDGLTLASGGMDQIIRLWKVGTWELQGQLAGVENVVSRLQFSPDGQSIFASSLDGTVRRFPAQPPPPHFRTLRFPTNEIVLGPSRQEEGLWTYDEASSELHLWDPEANATTRTIAVSSRPELAGMFVYSLSLRHGRWLCWVGTNTEVVVMDVEAPSKLRRVALPGKVGEYWTVSPDGNLLAGSFHTSSNTLQSAVWHLDSRSLDVLPADFAPNAGGASPPSGASFSDDGRFLGLMSRRPGDFTAMIWDVARRQPHVKLAGHEHLLTTLAFSPDGRWVGTCIWGGPVRVWDLASGAERLPPLKGPEGGVFMLQFTQDGRSVIGITSDSTLFVWHRQTHRQMLMLRQKTRVSQTAVLAGHDTTLWWRDPPPPTASGRPGLRPDGTYHIRATRLPTLAEIDAIEQGRGRER